MSESRLLTRPHFFSGKLLTVEDLTQEQSYFREKLKRHNRRLHGFGIVSGLSVTTASGNIELSSGMALDCEGNELLVETEQVVALPARIKDWSSAHLSLQYAEDFSNPVMVSGVEEFPAITESFEIVIDNHNHNGSHRHCRGRWLACGKSHPLTIAKLRRRPQGWRVDRRYRAPLVR
jgi:hypothetical protein